MTPTSLGPFLRHLRKILDPSRGANVSDTELLERFVQQRDEVAFELLVWRHQRLVWSVCCRVLGNAHDAEDAFQAAFLTLARKADSLLRQRSLAGWLHTVAFHIALRARKKVTKRATVELDPATLAALADPADEAVRRDLDAILDEEVNRLPEKYRFPIVLCYLEGKTYVEASRQLDVPVGTLSARLTKARDMLQTRLLRRGIGASGALLAAVLGEQVSSATASAALVNTTVQTAATGTISATVAALTNGVLQSMFIAKIKIAMLLVLAGSLVAGSSLLIPAALMPPASVSEPPAPAVPAAEAQAKHVRLDDYGDLLPDGALFRFGSLRMRHAGIICNSALSPDGKILATASRGSVILWDLAKGKPLRRFDCDHSGTFSIPGLVFSPNGKYLAYVQDYFAAYLWDVNSGKEIARFPRDLKHRHGLCQFTPDGEQLILNDGPNRVSFWQVQANKESRSLDLEEVTLLSPDARSCARIEPMGGITFFDARTGKQADRLQVTASYNGNVNRIAFAPDSKSLAVAHQNKEIQIRDFPSGELLTVFPLPDSTKYRVGDTDYWEYRLSFSTDGRTLLLGTKAGVVHRWDLDNRKELPSLNKHFGEVTSAYILPGEETMVTTGEDGLIRRWDNRTGRQLSEPPGYVGRTHAAYSPDGRLVAVGDMRGRLELWDARSGRLLRVLRRDGSATIKLTFTPHGESLAEARSDGAIHFWAVPSGEPQSILQCKGQNFRHLWSLHLSPDGRRVLVADVDYRASLWDRASGKQLWSGRFGPCAFSRDGKSVVIADGPYLQFLDAANGKKRAKVRLNTDTPDGLGVINTIVFSPDEQRLAVGLCVGTVYLCEARTGAEIAHFQAVDARKKPTNSPNLDRFGLYVEGLTFSSDGRWLCTSGWDGSVRLWEVATGREVLRRNGHMEKATEVSFGNDSRTVLSCGEDAQSYLWTLRPAGKQEANRSLESLWAALADEPARAYLALWTMSENKGAVDFLRGKLVPIKPVTNERLRRLIADLDSETYAVREMATKELADIGEAAAPSMQAALRDKPSLETRKRLEELIQRLEKKTLSANELRIVRAIDVLGRQGTAEAGQVLQTLAGSDAAGRTTRQAKEALRRLKYEPVPKELK